MRASKLIQVLELNKQKNTARKTSSAQVNTREANQWVGKNLFS